MAKIKKGILILTPFFSPNIGGTENQLDDLVAAIDSKGYKTFVQTYSPLTTKIAWKAYEKTGMNIRIWRYHWPGFDIFHRIEKYPLLSFLYLTPYLLIRTLLWMLSYHSQIDTIHAQGLNASLIGVILKKIFHKKLITSIHAIYEIDPTSLTAKLNYFVLKHSDKILATSDQSKKELTSFGINPASLDTFIPWIDLTVYRPYDREKSRKQFNLDPKKFTLLFVSRLIIKKGDRVLAKVAAQLPQFNFVFAGLGPEEDYIKHQSTIHSNIFFFGSQPRENIAKLFSLANIYCFPTLYEEGFGKVLIESLACGTPIITSNKGAIPKVVNSSVAFLIKPTVSNFKKAILDLYNHPTKLKQLKSNSVAYAKKFYGPGNAKLIYQYY